MDQSKAHASLGSVYGSGTAEEVAKNYAAWAATYDQETASVGYLLPFFITSWVARYVPAGEGPLLDVGCGTGLSGPCLVALGYDHMEGLDIAPEMLAIARGRGSYSDLKQAALGEELPWPDAYFRAVFSTGVFTIGHAPASGLHELVRITRPGGHLIFTIRDQVYEAGGFPEVMSAIDANGLWRKVEESPWFRAYAVSEPEARVKAFVYQRA